MNCSCGCADDKMARLKEIISSHKGKAGALIPIMHEAQELFGYLPYEVEKTIAEELDVPLADVYGITTFYSKFHLTAKGNYQINVCMGTACYVKGSESILEKIADLLQIPVGSTTPDGEFSLEATRCIGACGLAPVMTINESVYGQLTVEKAEKIINNYLEMVGREKDADV